MKLVLVLLSTAASLLAQTVQGTVINRLTGAPVGGVAVTLETKGAQPYKTTTDAQGAFRIEAVNPGVYTPRFDKRGFIVNGAVLRPLQVMAGTDPASLRVELTPMGKISGRVLDGEGNGLKAARVELFTSRTGVLGTTDDKGNFKFEELVPATYTLSARPPKDAKSMETPAGQRVAWVPTYYPGVIQRSGASRLAIAPGAELWNQDIKLIAAPVYRVHGVVLDPKGDPAPGVALELADPAEVIHKDGTVDVRSAPDGTFDLPDVRDGDWRLIGKLESGGVPMKAFHRVQVAGHDIERLEVRLGLPFSIQGTVALEAGDGSPARGKPTLVSLAPAVGGFDIITAHPDVTGKFTVDGIYPGPYQVLPISPGPQFYLASIRLGDRESVDGRVEFLSGGLPLRVTYRSDGGTVRGAVEDCRSATVVLAPQDETLRRLEYIRTTKCTAEGRYEIGAVRPGEYYAIALGASDPAFGFLTTDLNQSHFNAAAHVTVRPNEATLVDLRVTGER